MDDPLIRELLEQDHKTYTWWLYCNHATPAERRFAHDRVKRIEELLGGAPSSL